jgi:ABC-type uncharacterized transport system permease subunit
MTHHLLSQDLQIDGQIISGPLDPSVKDLGSVINKLVSFLIPFAAVILVLIFMWGGYDFLMSQGSADKLKAAKAKITAGIIGFVLLILAYFITNLFASLFGFKGL